MTVYRIRAGTKGLVRKCGEADWRPWTTTRDLEFTEYVAVDNGGRWLFRLNGYELKVASSQVGGRPPKAKRLPNASPGGGIPTCKGRGASGRRTMRFLRRHGK